MKRIVTYIINNMRYESFRKKIQATGDNCRVGKNCKVIGGQNITIGDNFRAMDGLVLQTWEERCGEKTGYVPILRIGDDVSIMNNCQISCAREIKIGNGVLFGDNVFVTDNFHGSNSETERDIIPAKRKLYAKGPVMIGDNVWLGRNVCIMPNVTIGKGAVIGANAVVTKDIPDYGIAVGVPASVVRR